MPPLRKSVDQKSYFLATFGCQMNISDSERIAASLERKGLRPVASLKEADLLVINMCSVRKSAVDRVRGILKKAKTIKENRPLETVLTGCYLVSSEQRDLLRSFDLVQPREDFFDKNEHYLKFKPKYHSFVRAYIPIMTGCDNFCAYCVVPYTRGREYSRPLKEIIEETRCLVDAGYREIWLLGQNVNSYRDRKNDFAELLKKANEIPGDFWIYFTSSHPKDLSDELIETMASSRKVAPYLNLPVQSGDDSVLEKMNRRYRVDDYRKKVEKLREAFQKNRSGPERRIALSTDIIVGFPGEDQAAFERTAKLMEDIKFDMAYIARYSPRPKTAAAEIKETVNEREKKQREAILTKILEKTALSGNRFYLKKTIPVLPERMNPVSRTTWGKTKWNKVVEIRTRKQIQSGTFVDVQIDQAKTWGLGGQIKKRSALNT